MAQSRHAVEHDDAGLGRAVERLDRLHDRLLRQLPHEDRADKIEPRHRCHHVDRSDAVLDWLLARFIHDRTTPFVSKKPPYQTHYPPLSERFAKAPSAPENPTPLETMAHRLKTPERQNLYALRKQTPEPVFGIIKSVMGFRQFSMRGLEKVRGEWSLVTMAWNIKRMFTLMPA